ncbi:hypothetical protein O3P69_002447 [Scylla paramamosain]|uniref:Ketoreductase domain-containing protein n=1 Tax=Scylla paramamosain TaxID=85552 RepID=A0AAW0ULR3_SCYPA
MVDWFLVACVLGGAMSFVGLCFLGTCVCVLLFLALIRFVIVPLDCDAVLKFHELFGKQPESLKGKVVWITGASSGIGAALAVRLARAGARLALSARSVEKLISVKQHCLGTGGVTEEQVVVVPLDLVQYDQHQAAFNTVLHHFGELDVLVNNAGRSQRGCWEEIHLDVDKELFEVDVFSTIALSRLVCKYFLEQGRCGHFAITSSVAGKFGVPMSGSYTAAKHALHGYFECLRTEKLGRGLTISMVCPGPVVSGLDEAWFTEQQGKKLNEKRTGKMMSAERCAELFAVTLANHLPETWIALQPVLLIMYISQYMPGLSKSVMQLLPLSFILKLRDGRADLTEPAK